MLEDSETIDLMGNSGNLYFFIIVDAGVTENLAERKELLRKKLATYAAAISSGNVGDQSVPRSNYRIQIVSMVDRADDYQEFQTVRVLDEQNLPIAIPVELRVRAE